MAIPELVAVARIVSFYPINLLIRASPYSEMAMRGGALLEFPRKAPENVTTDRQQ